MKKLLLLLMLTTAISVASAQDYIFKKFSDHFSISQGSAGINVYGNDIKDNLGNYFLKATSSSLQHYLDSVLSNTYLHLAGPDQTITQSPGFANNVLVNGVYTGYQTNLKYSGSFNYGLWFEPDQSILTGGALFVRQWDSTLMVYRRGYVRKSDGHPLADFQIVFPSKSGTVALTSDVPSVAGYVPYTGATSSVTLGTKDFTAQSLNTSGVGGHTLNIYGSAIVSTDNHIDISAPTFVEVHNELRVPQVTIANAPVNPTDGVRLTDLSSYPADADVVHKAGTETITGAKTFNFQTTFKKGSNYYAFTTEDGTSFDPIAVGNINLQNGFEMYAGFGKYRSGTYEQFESAYTAGNNINIRHNDEGSFSGSPYLGIQFGSAGDLDLYKDRIVRTTDGSEVAWKSDLTSYPADADVVHKAGTETITGAKTFQGDITMDRSGAYSNLTASRGFVIRSSAYGNQLAWTSDGLYYNNPDNSIPFSIPIATGRVTVPQLTINNAPSAPTDAVRLTDLTGAVSSSMTGYVPYTGATADIVSAYGFVSSKASAFGSDNGVSGSGRRSVSLGYNVGGGTPSLDVYSGANYASYRYDRTVFSDGTNSLYITVPTLTTAVQSISWPDAKSGTIALTSDLPSMTGYVPYTGATADIQIGTHVISGTQGTGWSVGQNARFGNVAFTSDGGSTDGYGAITLNQDASSPLTLEYGNHASHPNDGYLYISGGAYGTAKRLATTADLAGTGTVTSVSSANSDIAVATGTSTPVLTLNNLNGVTKSYYDPTSSIQTQLNSKQAAISGTGFVKASGAAISYDNTSYLPLTGGTLTNTTSPQFTLAYDATHTMTFAVSSTGTATIATTGNIVSFGTSTVRANTLVNTSNSVNSSLSLATTGTTVSSNKANADAVFTINNINTSSTGYIQRWQLAGTNVATLDKNGQFSPVSIGSAVTVTTQTPGTNDGTIASMAALNAERTATATLTNKTLTTPKLTGYTVATLPTGTLGMVAYVTDAVAPTYLGALTGGGSVVTPVFYNGTAWVAH